MALDPFPWAWLAVGAQGDSALTLLTLSNLHFMEHPLPTEIWPLLHPQPLLLSSAL